MSHQNPQVSNKAHEAGRTMFDALQGMAETTISIWGQMHDAQRKSFSDALHATRAQVQLMGKVNAPREFASAQADLVREYGQKYTHNISETVEFATQAWQKYGDRFEELESATGDIAVPQITS